MKAKKTFSIFINSNKYNPLRLVKISITKFETTMIITNNKKKISNSNDNNENPFEKENSSKFWFTQIDKSSKVCI